MLLRPVKSAEVLLKALRQNTVPCACFHKNYRQGTSESLYDVLGVPLYASNKEIKAAFIQLSKKFHPDADANDKTLHDKFVKINKAYNVLINPQERKIYDQGLRAGLHAEPDEVNTRQNWNPKHPQYYYHPRFYNDPEMRKEAAKAWEKNTGYSYADYYEQDREKSDHRRPKYIRMKIFAVAAMLTTLGYYIAYRQYKYAQKYLYGPKVKLVHDNEKRNQAKTGPSRATASQRKTNKDISEEKDLSEDKMAGPLVYQVSKT